ncbi:MAG: zinc ribbon domain-containing protein [Nannocystaceae bacterium]|nr:zinc ribbon domain-containing protein [Nannocystaceae bacterium]
MNTDPSTGATEPLCQRCESPLEPEDLRCAVCALPVPISPLADVQQAVTQILRCNGCGAAVRYLAEIGAPRCDFCDSVMEIETPEDPVEQAEFFVRFAITDEQARKALKRWLGGLGFFRPSDLQSRAAVDALKPLWWVGWMFDAEGTMTWAADSNAGSRRADWAPHSGQAPLRLHNVVVPASRGLTEVECRGLIASYDISNVATQPPHHDRATFEQFAVQRSAARKIISGALEAAARNRAVPLIPGARHRKLSVAVLPTRLVSRHYAFPAYVLAYRYRDKLYRAIVHGQDATCVVGKAPISWARVAAVALAVIALIAVVATIATA